MTGGERVIVGCLTCGVETRLATYRAHELVEQARRFFTRHGECLTTLDLRSYRALTSAVAYRCTPTPRASGE